MTRPWCRFALGALALQLAALAGAASPPDLSDSARMLPPDTVFILHADLAALRNNTLYRRLTGQAPGLLNPFIQGPLQPGLFDVEKDLDAVTLGMGSDLRSVYVVLRGRFPAQTFDSIARSSGAFVEEKQGELSVFRLKRESGGPDALSTYAVLGEQTLLVAADRSFGALLDAARGSGPNAATSPLLRDLLGRGTRGQISVDLHFTDAARRRLGGAAGPLGPMEELDALQSLQVGIDFGAELELYARGGTGDEASSQRLFDAAMGWLAIGRMLLGAETVGTALNKLQIERHGADLSFSLRLSAEEAELLFR